MQPPNRIIRLRVTQTDGDVEILNIRQGVLCKRSRFFQIAMGKEWVERREDPDIIDFPEELKQAARDYINWLYTGQIQVEPYDARKPRCREDRVKEAERIYAILAEAYNFGEKVMDINYKNAVAMTFVLSMKSSKWSPGPSIVNTIYRGTPPTAPLRRLIADSVASSECDDTDIGGVWMEYFDEISREALVDAVKAIARERTLSKGMRPRTMSFYLEEEEEKI